MGRQRLAARSSGAGRRVHVVDEPRQPSVLAIWDALSDPTRWRVLDALVMCGQASLVDLGRMVPAAKGGLGWHMARLEKAGLVELVSGTGRKRVWRALPPPALAWDPVEVAADRYASAALAEWEHVVTMRRWLRVQAWATSGRVTWPGEWTSAAVSRDYLMRLTPDELDELDTALHEVIARYRDRRPVADPHDGAEGVFLTLTAFPVRPGE